MTAARPIVPAPSTSTRWPSDSPATRTPWTATPSGSDSAAVAKGTPSGTGKQCRAGSRMKSANPPGMVIPTIPIDAQ